MATIKHSTSAPATAGETHKDTQAQALPREWMSVKEACEYARFSKPLLYGLMNRGLVKSCSLRERGRIKGKRTVCFDSLRAFLESRATGGQST